MSSVRRPHGRLFQIRGPAVPKLLSPKLLCVNTWHRTHVIRGRPKGSSIAFGDEMDIVSQVRRHLTAQCLAHQTGEFELHSPPNRKPVQLTQHRRNVVTTSGSGDETCCGILQRLDSPHDVLGHSVQKRIAVVQTARYERLNQCLGSFRIIHSE